MLEQNQPTSTACCLPHRKIDWHWFVLTALLGGTACDQGGSDSQTAQYTEAVAGKSVTTPLDRTSAVTALAQISTRSHSLEDRSRQQVAPQPRPPRRIVHAWDGVTMWATIFNTNYYPSPNREIPPPDAQFSQRMLEEMVDEEAAAEIDTISYCLFTAFWSDVPASQVTELFPWRPPGMDEAGVDCLKVLIDRCHHHDMKFIADIRMNDRHGGPRKGLAKEHPEWALLGSGNDYAISGVRDAMLTFVQEVLDGYDVDGVEYDYMRWCHMFQPGEGKQNAHLLTDLSRRTRKLLDDAAHRRGIERLEFGVRVPQTLRECDYLGFDLETWIKEGLVDYVVPSDFFHSDTNMKTEDFVKLAAGTNCKIYPAIHPMIAMDAPNEHYRLMQLVNYRAAAQNYYEFGADGISPYNYQRGFSRRATAHRSTSSAAYMWPAALGWLRELRDPQEVQQRDRHYLFYSLYKKPRKSPTGFSNDENIYLDRSAESPVGTRRFRMAEKFGNRQLRTTLQFKAVGLADDERLKIWINGQAVPIDYISRVHDKNGQNVYEGDTLPPFDLFVIDMNWQTTGRKQPLVFGDNVLKVKLDRKNRGTSSKPLRFNEMVLGVQADDQGGVSSVDLNGYLDDFAVWSRILSDQELRSVYQNGSRDIGIAAIREVDSASKLDDELQVLYEFDRVDAVTANSRGSRLPASQVGPAGVLVTQNAKAPRIGRGAGDFTQDDATLKLHSGDMRRLMDAPSGDLTIAYWFKTTARNANHTVWATSNEAIPSLPYRVNRANAMLATHTIQVADPETVLFGFVRPGVGTTARTEATVTDGKWHHLAVTLDQDPARSKLTIRLFVDGTPSKTPVIDDQSIHRIQGIVSIEELESYVYVRK